MFVTKSKLQASLAVSFALHFSGRAAARLDEPPLTVCITFVTEQI